MKLIKRYFWVLWSIWLLVIVLFSIARMVQPTTAHLEEYSDFNGIRLTNSSFGTATPALLIQNGGSGNSLEIRNSSGTPVSSISNGGVLSGFGSSGLSVSPNLEVAAPTAVGTATPAALINNLGVSKLLDVQDTGVSAIEAFNGGGVKITAPTAVATAVPAFYVDSSGGLSNLFEVRDSATPVFQINDGGVIDVNGKQIDLDADNDTSITASTDDQIDFEIGGADEVVLTAASLDLNNTIIDQDVNTENLMLPTVLTSTASCAVGAGCTGTVATIGDGEIWLVHSLFIQTTVNVDCTGDDCTLVVGDGNDPNGFISAADANLQTTFTEATGYAAGFYGIEAGSGGAYTLDDGGPFVYAPSGAAETIDYTFASTGDDLSAGTVVFYVVYTRIK